MKPDLSVMMSALALSLGVALAGCSSDEGTADVSLRWNGGTCEGFVPNGAKSKDRDLATEALEAWQDVKSNRPSRDVCIIHADEDGATSVDRDRVVLTDGLRVATYVTTEEGGRIEDVGTLPTRAISVSLGGQRLLLSELVTRVWVYADRDRVMQRTERPRDAGSVLDLDEPIEGKSEDQGKPVVLVAETTNANDSHVLPWGYRVSRDQVESVLKPGYAPDGAAMLDSMLRGLGADRAEYADLTLVGYTSDTFRGAERERRGLLVGVLGEASREHRIFTTVGPLADSEQPVTTLLGTSGMRRWSLAGWLANPTPGRAPVLLAAMSMPWEGDQRQGGSGAMRGQVYVGTSKHQVVGALTVVPFDVRDARRLPTVAMVGFDGEERVLEQAAPVANP